MKIKRKTVQILAQCLRIIAGVLLVSIVIYFYFGTQVFTTMSFSFIGIDKEDTIRVEEALTKELTKKQGWIFPTNKVLTPPTKAITSHIKELLPNTNIVKVRASGIHALTIEVVPYIPLFRLPEGKAIDREGVVYKEQHDISMLPIFIVATGTPTKTFLNDMSGFIVKAGTIMFPVTRIVIDSTEDVYLGEDNSSSTLRLRKDVDFKKAWSTLVSALDTDPLKTMMQTNKKNLEYIDLRFGNKVFYKFTNGVPVSIISSHNATSTTTTTVR